MLPSDVHQDWDAVIYFLEEQCSALILIPLFPSSRSLSKHRCAVTGENPWRFYKTTWAFVCVSNLSQQHTAAHVDLRDPCLLKSFILQNRWCWRQSIQCTSNKRVRSTQLCRCLSCVPQKVYMGEDLAAEVLNVLSCDATSWQKSFKVTYSYWCFRWLLTSVFSLMRT